MNSVVEPKDIIFKLDEWIMITTTDVFSLKTSVRDMSIFDFINGHIQREPLLEDISKLDVPAKYEEYIDLVFDLDKVYGGEAGWLKQWLMTNPVIRTHLLP